MSFQFKKIRLNVAHIALDNAINVSKSGSKDAAHVAKLPLRWSVNQLLSCLYKDNNKLSSYLDSPFSIKYQIVILESVMTIGLRLQKIIIMIIIKKINYQFSTEKPKKKFKYH